MRIAVDNARANGCGLPSADLFVSRLEKSVERDEGELDSSVVSRVLEDEAR